jgi:GLPGLI family protein
MVYKDEDPGAAAGKIIPQVMGASIHNFCNYDIYKNYPEKQVTNTISYLNKKHLKVRESLSFDWKILPGKDSLILGLPCKLAATSFAGREYFAWFTPEIPISDGPYKFSGLPGLIVSVSDVEKQHRFELMSIQIPKHKPQTFYVKNDFIEVTPADYLKAIHLKTSQLYNRIQQEDGITPKNDESKANALNNLKARNNFIEKY